MEILDHGSGRKCNLQHGVTL